MRNLPISFGLYSLLLVCLLVLPCIASASGSLSHIITNAMELKDWVETIDYESGGYIDPIHNPPRSLWYAPSLPSPRNNADWSLVRYGKPALDLGLLNFAIRWPYGDIADYEYPSGGVPLALELDFWPAGAETNLIFWENVFGRWNELIQGVWRGGHAPVFARSTSSGVSSTTSTRWWLTSLDDDEMWELTNSVAVASVDFPRWILYPIFAVYRANYQSGDDWVYCDLRSLVAYLVGEYDDDFGYGDYPSYLSIPVWFPDSQYNYRYRHNIIITNTFTSGWWSL